MTATELKREYYKKYREKNKEQIKKKYKEWRDNNKEKVKEYNRNYWNKKASEVADFFKKECLCRRKRIKT